MTKITNKELLYKAGRLAIAAERLCAANMLTVSACVEQLQEALTEYNNAIIQATQERH